MKNFKIFFPAIKIVKYQFRFLKGLYDRKNPLLTFQNPFHFLRLTYDILMKFFRKWNSCPSHRYSFLDNPIRETPTKWF